MFAPFFILEGESRLAQQGKPFCPRAVSKGTITPQKPTGSFAVLSFLVAHWPPSSTGKILNGANQGEPSSPGHPRGAGMNLAELGELREFSLCLWESSWGFHIFPPSKFPSWLSTGLGGGCSQEVTACRDRQAGPCEGPSGFSFLPGAALGPSFTAVVLQAPGPAL